ncbi:MAG: hypothetical protein JWO56_3486 [Acidobacteria bacterium]|nr:hypothetical protein [Acidobacteriota bacterium]
MPATKVLIPEVVEPDESLPIDLVALRRFAWLLDEAIAIPGTRRRIGVDAIVGFIPGVGDVIGGVLSAWIVIGGLRHRVPLPKIIRMLVNIGLDLLIGAIPFLGDFFDFLFEENVMNMDLLLRHRNRALPPRSHAEVMTAAIVVVLIVLAMALIPVAVTIALALWLIGHRNG